MPGGKKPIPKGTAKDNRMYEHIKASELKEGRPLAQAKSIAAATVNQYRAKKKGK